MNRIELQDNGFPWTAKAVRFAQAMTTDNVRMLCKIFGDNFIAYGVEVSGQAVSAGAIVINGELLPFEAGTYNAKVAIEETSESETYYDDTQRNAFFTRKAKCSATGSYNLADFPRIGVKHSYTESAWVDVPQNSDLEDASSSLNGAVNLTPVAGSTLEGTLKAKRMQNGEVFVYGGGKYMEGDELVEFTYGTLPSGFRPNSDRIIRVTADYESSGSKHHIVGYATVKPNGDIVCPSTLHSGFKCMRIYFNTSFTID